MDQIKSVGYEDILPFLGNFGKYQRKIYFLLCLPVISYGLHTFVAVFLLATPGHRCELPLEEKNYSYHLPQEMWRENYPIDSFTNKFSKCSFFRNSGEIVNCDSWVYDDSKFKETLSIEWDLVCGRSFLRATANSIFMFGDLIGGFIFGHLSDKYGRKPTFFACLVMQLVFGILCGLAPEYVSFAVCRMMIGAASCGVFIILYVISIEMVGPKIRLYASEVIMMFFSCGYMLTAAFAYFIDYWRFLQIAISLPGILFLSYWFFISESIRWLLANNQREKAVEIIKRAAETNGVSIPEQLIDGLMKSTMNKTRENEKPSIVDLFRYPNLRRRTFLLCLNFFIIAGTYYGLSWNTHSLGENRFTNFVISGAVEIPAYFFDMLTLNRFGRRIILQCCMVFAGTTLLLTSLIPSNMEWLIVFLAMLGKMAITSSYGTIFILANEQFPTVVRNIGLGAAVMSSRIGAIAAPFLVLLSDVWGPLPMLILGSLTLLGGISARLLPETLNKELPETLEDENFGRDVK